MHKKQENSTKYVIENRMKNCYNMLYIVIYKVGAHMKETYTCCQDCLYLKKESYKYISNFTFQEYEKCLVDALPSNPEKCGHYINKVEFEQTFHLINC